MEDSKDTAMPMPTPSPIVHRPSSLDIRHGDNREVLKTFADNTFHAIVTDPPYHLTTGKKGGSGPASVNLKTPHGRARITTGFMGKAWDGGDIAFNVEMWRECLRVLRPGGYLLSFGGSRTYHRMACAIEDAGFEIRDMIEWLYGSGFPKSLDVSKAMDKAQGKLGDVIGTKTVDVGIQNGSMHAGRGSKLEERVIRAPATAESRAWHGWGTALKPAHEPICVARKALDGTVVENVLKWGCGAVNVDGCRVPGPNGDGHWTHKRGIGGKGIYGGGGYENVDNGNKNPKSDMGRFPANLILDSEAAAMLDAQSGELKSGKPCGIRKAKNKVFGQFRQGDALTGFGDTGGASRFFYTAKASGTDRGNTVKGALPLFDISEEEFRNTHPTVKPLALMRYLLKLVVPGAECQGSGKRPHVLDPFLGSGTTAVACRELGFDCTGIELEAEHMTIIYERLGMKATV